MLRSSSADRCFGFTLIEMVVVMAIVAILALMAVPTMQDKLVRDQIVEAVRLADIAKPPVAAAWRTTQVLPSDNAGAGLPSADKIVSNWVSSVAVESGALQITFGNQANGAIRGKTLSLRPAVVDDAPIVPVSWICGHAPPPARMTAKGLDKTDIEERFLPHNCRAVARPVAGG